MASQNSWWENSVMLSVELTFQTCHILQRSSVIHMSTHLLISHYKDKHHLFLKNELPNSDLLLKDHLTSLLLFSPTFLSQEAKSAPYITKTKPAKEQRLYTGLWRTLLNQQKYFLYEKPISNGFSHFMFQRFKVALLIVPFQGCQEEDLGLCQPAPSQARNSAL